MEPIKLLIDSNGKEITSGNCCVCGEKWDLNEYKPQQKKQIKRYLDGRPIDFKVTDINNVCYCKHCNNVTVFEYPFSDKCGVRDKYNNDEYKRILNSDEPIEVRRVKLAEYKFKNTKDDNFVLSILHLYWYYDSINDIGQRNQYAQKLINLYERNIVYNIKVEPMCLLKIDGAKFNLNLEMILIDVYRRMGYFEKAKELINTGRNKLFIKDDNIIQMKLFRLQFDLCEKQDINRY